MASSKDSDSFVDDKKKRFRVIIVGGSVAGLTLAHCLYNSDIDFVLLEGRNEIAPQVGASIVVLRNGARILDQLGIFNVTLAIVEPLVNGLTWIDDGKLVVNSNAPELTGKRMGYPLAFLQRHNSGATVYSKDGSSYRGDIVVGADGIHSAVRSLMQGYIETLRPGTTEKDRNSISVEYNCIFGLGNAVKGVVVPGDSHRTYSKDHSTLSFVGKGGKLYWFLFTKLDKRYYGKEIPKYTTVDAEEAAKAFFNIHMTNDIKFEEVWDQRTFVNMVCVEESQNEHWTSGRIVCIGDSVHKMTPNLGAGGNAALTNSLSSLRAYYEKQHPRASIICDSANQLTRLESFRTVFHKLLALYVIPTLGDFLSDITCDSMVGAEILETLPKPPRSLEGTMPQHPEPGVGKKENKWIRALYALPLLLVVYGAQKTIGGVLERIIPTLIAAAKTGEIVLGNGDIVPLDRKFFGVGAIDKFLSILVSFFTPALGGFDPLGKLQGLAFGADLIPLQVIMLVEGIRRGNFRTAAHLLPTILGVAYQAKGLGYIAPIYFFLHYVQSPLENYQAADNRLTQMGPVKTILPTIALTYVLPSVAMFAAPTLATRQWINGVFWQAFPVYSSIAQRVFGLFVKDTTEVDRVSNPEADMPYLRWAYGVAAATAAFGNLYVRFASPFPLMDVFFKDISSPTAPATLIQGAARFLRYDQITTFGAGALWIMLSFMDLKKAGKVRAGWGKIVAIFSATTLIGGPGAAMMIMWAWREEALARKKPAVEKK
ncbi:hypothetical protein G7Y89_g2803 [Cudoniella acicularis]|uniref:FAD-binding domain-containing protein n=1 Tax=Cudoniella acicularis TaxID=354080 RepID=A0A8H4RVL8_9HELO|nr:hypothetical protein G7Y89_g2803 [Cudoniella acicularis]